MNSLTLEPYFFEKKTLGTYFIYHPKSHNRTQLLQCYVWDIFTVLFSLKYY